MIHTASIRELKDKLSAYLKHVQRGDLVLVSDRGRVIAEIREPTLSAAALDAVQLRERQLSDRGDLRLGLGNSAEAYAPATVNLAGALIDEALAAQRGD